jgi:transcriptional regulator of nitric oxide reductase
MKSINGRVRVVLLWIVASSAMGWAADPDPWPHVSALFPRADRLGRFQGKPPAALVYAGEERLGYVFLTDRIVPIRGYSGQPISTLVGITDAAEIQGVRIVHHLEPILQAGISEQDLSDFVAQYQGISALQDIRIEGREAPGRQVVDGISGATITVMVVNASVTESLKQVLPALGIGQ